MLSNVFKYLRTDDWLDSKVPFMISVAVFSYLYNESNMSYLETYAALGSYFLYVSMFLAFSYVINDFADMEIDKKAGKQKVMFKLPKTVVVLSMIMIVLTGILPMLFIVQEKIAFLAYTLFLYVTGAAYSVHWLLRFKERGLIGLIECSVAQRCLPLIPLIFLFTVNWIFFAIFIILSFINGLRYILIHQAVDYENDIKTGVKTFVTEGHNKYRTAIITAFVMEGVLFTGVLIKLCSEHVYVIVIMVIYCVFEKIIATVVTKYMNVDLFCTFLAVPLEALYNVLFPVMTALILTISSGVYIGVFVFLAVLTFKCFKGKAAFISVYAKSKTEKHRTSKER